jgi:hypothetical protein
MKLSKKELLRRIKLTKPCTTKRVYYGLLYIAKCTMIDMNEIKDRKN